MGRRMLILAVLAAGLFGAAGFLSAADDGSVVVLDTAGTWRMHQVMMPPLVATGTELKPMVTTGGSGMRGGGFWQKLLGKETAPPPQDWTKTDLDDSTWVQGTAAAYCHSPYLARLCLRSEFTVTEAAKVKGLKLSLGYSGGVVVSVNGQEVARKDIKAGSAVADAYPKDVFVKADGKLISLRGMEYIVQQDKLRPEIKDRIAQRTRTLEAAIPGEALQAGVNVLAIEVVRAPYDQAIGEQMAVLDSHGTFNVLDLSWNTCELKHVQLRAATAEGLVPNAVRPAGLQIWNSDPLAVDFDLDFGSQAEPLRPVRLVGARSGTYSGKVVVGSDQALKGLVAAPAGDLSGPGGTIPAANVRIRYALPWSSVPLANGASFEPTPYPAEALSLMALAEKPLDEVAVYAKQVQQEELDPEQMWRYKKWGLGNLLLLRTPHQPKSVFGAVVPVWITVKIPAEAKPGTYAGRVTVQVAGKKLADVPLEVTVIDWTLPDPQNFRTWVELIQAPDTTAVEYGLPLWSSRHWEMIERSLKLVGDLGSKVVYIPLIAESNAGNAESMVRWIDKGGGKYEYDFSIMERYLDAVEKNMGRPKFVVFNVWDRYLIREGNLRRKKDSLKLAQDGPIVTVLKADGKTENITLPDYPEPESKALWQPLFTELRKRMAKRNLEGAMALGMVSDFWASKEQAAFLKEVSGGLSWVNASHYYQKTFHDGLAGFVYQATYFSARHAYGKLMHGWKEQPEITAAFERVGLDGYSMSKWRILAEESVTGNVRGIGRLGADTWYAVKDKNGKRIGRVWSRFPAADWGYLNCNSSTLAAGPDGPVASQRYEALREGLEECEAIVVLDEALTDAALRARIGDDLAGRCEKLLAERNDCMWRSIISWQCGPKYNLDPTGWRETATPTGHTWFVGSLWQQRSAELYTLAGEVTRALKK